MRSIALFICLLLCACGSETGPPLVATDVVITEPMPARHMSAGYVSFANNTDQAISISHIISPEFESVEIHESLLEDGVAKMRRLDELSIPANSSVSLQRGGKHLMLMRPSGAPESVSLSFYSGDTLLLSLEAPITRRNK